MEKDEKLVYVPMAADTVHPGHLNILKTASKLGRVMVGLFTDEAIASYKEIPVMSYEDRKLIMEEIKGVDCVVKQDTRDYEPNLRKYKPDFMVHGTDWRVGPLSDVREKAIRVMAEWGGTVVEPAYTEGISSSQLHRKMAGWGKTQEEKRRYLKRLLELRDFISLAGVFSAQTACEAALREVKTEEGERRRLDGLWMDMEGLARFRGWDSCEYLETEDYVKCLIEIGPEVEKPMIVPVFCRSTDIGEREKRLFQALEQAGASAVAVMGGEERVRREAVSRFQEWRKDRTLSIWVWSEFSQAGNKGERILDCGQTRADGILCKYDEDGGASRILKPEGIPVIAVTDKALKPMREVLKRSGYSGILIKDGIAEGVKTGMEEAVGRALRAIC